GLDELCKFHVDVGKLAGNISGFRKISEDVGKVGRVDGALCFLPGDSVVEFVLPGRVVRGQMPSALGNCRAAEDHVGSPLVGNGAILRVSCALPSVSETVGGEGLSRSRPGCKVDG